MATLTLNFDSSTIQYQKSDNFQVNFSTPIDLNLPDGNAWYAALTDATMWYSIYNISAEFGNNTFRYNNGTTWKTITFSNGSYQLAQINAYIQQILSANGDMVGTGNTEYPIVLTPNISAQRIIISVYTGYTVDLSVGAFAAIIGFNPLPNYTGIYQGDLAPDISRGVDKIHIHCDFIEGSYNNSVSDDILYSAALVGLPGSLINVQPYERIYLPVKKTRFLSSARIRFTDQSGRAVNFNGENTTVGIHLESRKIPV